MDTTTEKLHVEFSFYGKNAKEWMRKCILLLPEIEKNRVWEKKHFSDIYEYARILAGMSRYTVNEALRTLQKVADKPALLKVIEQKGINAIKPILTIVTKETAEFWAKKANDMSKHTLETYREEYLKEKNGLPGKPKKINSSHQQAIVNLEETLAMNLKKETIKKLQNLKGTKTWEELMQQFLALQEKEVARLQKEAKARFQQEHKTNQRMIPSKIKKYAKAKTNGLCAFPGCNKPGIILHHTDRFGIYHEHNPEKIHLLCKSHEHLAHLGYIENEQNVPEKWHIKQEAYQSEIEQYSPEYETDKVVKQYYNGGKFSTV